SRAPNRFAVASAALAASLAASSPCDAFERQSHIGGGPTVATLAVSDASAQIGLGVTAHYAYGLNDSYNLLVDASALRFGVGGDRASG
ncbi:hypothetical protein ABTC77_19205, partial [Acinetobacter baumannii]